MVEVLMFDIFFSHWSPLLIEEQVHASIVNYDASYGFVAYHCIQTGTATADCRLRTGDEIEIEGKPRIDCRRQTL